MTTAQQKAFFLCLHGNLCISSGREEGGEGGIPSCPAGSTPSVPPGASLPFGHRAHHQCCLHVDVPRPSRPCQVEMDPTGMQPRASLAGAILPAGLGILVGRGIRVCGAVPALQEGIVAELVEMFKSGAGEVWRKD